MKKILIEKLQKSYPKSTWKLENIDLEIEEGKFLVLVGPSGSGKSTLLRILAGLEKADSGKIQFFPDNKVEIAMVFQHYALYPHLNVFDNIAFPLRLKGEKKDKIEEKVQALAKQLNIYEYLQRESHALSGGQKQRVALARAIIREADIFLFDEALANLDASLRHQMRYELLALHKKLKKSFLYVTHDQVEAMSMADRLVIMKEGRIVQVGSPKEIYENPNSLFVASFLGHPSMNIFQKEDYFLGIRPEDIRILEKESKDSFSMCIEYFEFLGSHYYYHGQWSGQKLIVQASKEQEYKIGDSLILDFPLEKLYYFDLSTEERIPPKPIEK